MDLELKISIIIVINAMFYSLDIMEIPPFFFRKKETKRGLISLIHWSSHSSPPP